MAATADSVTVITGTLFESTEPESIGRNHVAVPSHFYKAILITRGTNRTMLAAILPNSSGITAPLSHFLTTVDEVERRSNLDLFSSLPDAEEAALEATRPDPNHPNSK
ncbi:MAG: DNA/RNA non-specific endonuclease [Bryobacterales bacterium]|nr:DNA/RNA non-specific endonuclease [Bryobacterales bacterium]